MHSSKQINIRRKYESKLRTIDTLEKILNSSTDDALITAMVKRLLREYGVGKEDEYSFILNKYELIEYLDQLKERYQEDIAIKLYTGDGINRKRSSRRLNIL